MYFTADIIRKLVYIDQELANSLIRSCKSFKRWILEERNCVQMLGSYYANKWESLIQQQCIRILKPNKREIYRPIINQMIPGAPAFNENMALSLDYILISENYRGYGDVDKHKQIELGWNIGGYISQEYRNISWYEKALHNVSSRNAFFLLFDYSYALRYLESIKLYYNKPLEIIQTPMRDLLDNFYMINSIVLQKDNPENRDTTPKVVQHDQHTEVEEIVTHVDQHEQIFVVSKTVQLFLVSVMTLILAYICRDNVLTFKGIAILLLGAHISIIIDIMKSGHL